MNLRIAKIVVLLLVSVISKSQSIDYVEINSITYTTAMDSTSRDRCKLDLHLPQGEKDFVTVVWFHGGGLTGGDKGIPQELKNKGVGVISAGYRFASQVSVDDIIRDAAAAVKWSYDHIEQYGGNKHKIIIAGYSAGAYLALMLGLNKAYLRAESIDVDKLMGVISLSGQTITHFAARQALGIAETQPLIDQLSPLYWIRKDALPITLITGDRELEILGRYEENSYLKRMLNIVGHQRVRLLELDGYDHGMTVPAFPLLLKQAKNWSVIQKEE